MMAVEAVATAMAMIIRDGEPDIEDVGRVGRNVAERTVGQLCGGR
jgi:hypothetical protein